MFPIKMTQHRPSASAVHHGKHQVTSRQARSNSLRVKTDHQVPAWQCAAQKAAQRKQMRLTSGIRSWASGSEPTGQLFISFGKTGQATYTGNRCHTTQPWPLFKHGRSTFELSKAQTGVQPRYIHLLLRQRPLTRACLYDNQCWFVMLTVAFALARTVSRLHLLLQKA